jgi:hypothetical protein
MSGVNAQKIYIALEVINHTHAENSLRTNRSTYSICKSAAQQQAIFLLKVGIHSALLRGIFGLKYSQMKIAIKHTIYCWLICEKQVRPVF